MADVPVTAWSELTPDGNDSINAGDNRIREMKGQIREIVGVDHDFPSSGQDGGVGQHYRITLQEQSDLGTGVLGSANTQSTEDDTNDVGICLLGAQTCDDLQGNDPVTTKPELVFTDEDDDDVQITSNGKIHLDNGRLTNEAYLQGRNADNDGDIDILRVRTLTDTEESYTLDADIIEVGTAMVIKGDLSVEGDTAGDAPINGIQADNIIAREAMILQESSGYTTDENEAALYTKNDGTQTELYFKGEDDGDEIQITKGSGLKIIGTRVDKSSDYGAQQAATDGIVTVISAPGTNQNISGYTDSNSNPTTKELWIRYYNTGESNHAQTASMWVKKGDYWKIVVSAGSLTSVKWIPLG